MLYEVITQTAALVKSGAVCIAYETITGSAGGLPLLAPMSEVAGRMAVQAGAAHLENVITSYSIHYTKLYELTRMPRGP